VVEGTGCGFCAWIDVYITERNAERLGVALWEPKHTFPCYMSYVQDDRKWVGLKNGKGKTVLT
jgi:hypothetical protein